MTYVIVAIVVAGIIGAALALAIWRTLVAATVGFVFGAAAAFAIMLYVVGGAFKGLS